MKALIEVPGYANVRPIPDVPDAIVLLSECGSNILSSICGSVVRDDEFKILERLVQQRPNPVLEMALTVEHREGDAHPRQCEIPSQVAR
jgi:hypothetical protein